MKIIIWKYRNEEYISYYARFETPDKEQAVKELNDEQLKKLGVIK